MDKSADIRLLQCELNDLMGVCTKITGTAAAVATAIEAGRRVAEQMHGQPVAQVIPRVEPAAMAAIVTPASSTRSFSKTPSSIRTTNRPRPRPLRNLR